MRIHRNLFLSILALCILVTLQGARAETKVSAAAEDSKSGTSTTQQMLCNKRSEVMKNLSLKYKEAPTALGMSSSGGVIEVMTSKDGQTWTVLLTRTDGSSCLVAMGSSWENVKYIAAGPNT